MQLEASALDLETAAAVLSTPKSVDVGKVQGNEQRRFEFAITNISGREIEIRSVESSCDCTNLKLNGSTILSANSSRTVTGQVNFGRMALGEDATSITISFQQSDGKIGRAVIPLRGEVVAAVVLDRAKLSFNGVNPLDETQALTITARRGNSGEEWDDIRVVSEDEHLAAEVTRISEDEFKITVTFSKLDLPISTFNGKLVLKLASGPDELPYNIPIAVNAQIRGPLTIKPTSIYLGAVNPNEIAEKSVIISSEFELLDKLSIDSQPESGTVEITNIDNNTIRVNFRLFPTEEAGVIGDSVLLRDEDSGTRVKVPILGVVKKTTKNSEVR